MASNGIPPPEQCAAGLLDVIPAVMRTIRAKMREDASVELSVVQFRALARADRSGGCSVSELAEHVGLTLPSASKLVERLVRRGYLRRRPDHHDRRVTLVASTRKGHDALESARRAAKRQLTAMLKDLPPVQRAHLAAALDALRPIFLDADTTATKAR
jgi:DNA-binding MarR family transcriptional regulator